MTLSNGISDLFSIFCLLRVCWRGLNKGWEENDQLTPVTEHSCFPANVKGLLGQREGAGRKSPFIVSLLCESMCAQTLYLTS